MDLLVGTLLLRPYVFLFLAVFAAAAGGDLGWRRAPLFGAVIWPVAWAAEWSSVHVGVPFGFYRYTGLTRGQELYVAGVPLFDSLSFTFLAYASYCLARRAALAVGARPGGVGVAVLSGFFMMMLDVVIDPAAVRGERWFLGDLFAYPNGGAYFGVPLSNFAGWWIVGAVGVLAYLACARDGGAADAGRPEAGIALYYAVFGFNLAVTGWIGEWTLVAVGFAFHGLMALGIMAIAWRAPSRRMLRTRRIERA
jgi:uncharacterized membrane protein